MYLVRHAILYDATPAIMKIIQKNKVPAPVEVKTVVTTATPPAVPKKDVASPTEAKALASPAPIRGAASPPVTPTNTPPAMAANAIDVMREDDRAFRCDANRRSVISAGSCDNSTDSAFVSGNARMSDSMTLNRLSGIGRYWCSITRHSRASAASLDSCNDADRASHARRADAV